MSHTEQLTRYVANFIDELAQGEMTDVVISPGSRSTPLAMTFAEHPKIKHWIHMDERSAAFFALGMAREQRRPVAIVCTSGTAAANYYPAIVEAFYSRIPLVVLTADRPHELRDVGSPQAIDQINMFDKYVKWFQEMALPEDHQTMLQYVRSMGSRALSTAQDSNPGPVHLNFPFRSPLVPDFTLSDVWGEERNVQHRPVLSGKRTLKLEQIQFIKEKIASHSKGVIVCGPQMDPELAEAVTDLAKHLQLPVFADPLSQVRAGYHEKDHVIESYDAILKSEEMRQKFKPDFILRFGAMPVSKPFTLMLHEHPEITQFVFEDFEGHREPTHTQSFFVYADGTSFCHHWVEEVGTWMFDKAWLDKWREANRMAKACLLEDSYVEPISEGHVITNVMDSIQASHAVFIGNSMPVRDLDTFFFTTPKPIEVYANRGANGIDGVISSALGTAAHGKEVTLIVGDISFYHDVNGLLMAKQYGINLRVIVVNNEGGGIFSFLPQASSPDHFETLFGTPLQLDFQKVTEMYGGTFYRASSWDEFQESLNITAENSGLQVIEVITNRQDNADWHRGKWSKIKQALLQL
ncbi:2-succinyl-5-enolpyruvyl-6-hydroxy-3-cyclohexene-1-carboxylic-acid synthase [Pontibacillus salicampi]|uniref:2-succinyl-5-enolpyruvyl-6-hydroxy-3-cyclohexene-1-carboxylate synthase n=1 Tax=Pontibacillus salicampi TaxID=1449801 RepID=A0ABV6LND5_9BACI